MGEYEGRKFQLRIWNWEFGIENLELGIWNLEFGIGIGIGFWGGEGFGLDMK